eukprot:2938086-Rhodomonas_salina.1
MYRETVNWNEQLSLTLADGEDDRILQVVGAPDPLLVQPRWQPPHRQQSNQSEGESVAERDSAPETGTKVDKRRDSDTEQCLVPQTGCTDTPNWHTKQVEVLRLPTEPSATPGSVPILLRSNLAGGAV